MFMSAGSLVTFSQDWTGRIPARVEQQIDCSTQHAATLESVGVTATWSRSEQR